MKPVLEAFTTLNKTIEMKSSEKSPTSRLTAKRNTSNYRKSVINKYRKGNTLFASGKRQRTIGDFFPGRVDKKQPISKPPKRPNKSSKNCLLERSHQKNTVLLDETSSSSFTYSSNSQRFIDVDIAGHCSRLDVDGRLEVLELADNQSFNRSENEESEKENSPRLKRSQSGGRSTMNPEATEGKEFKQLNQASVKELEYCEESLRDDFCRPEGYYRYLEGDSDERQENVEYDLDNEDMCWLNLVNNTKCDLAGNLTQDSLELAMDRLEKVCAHLQLNSIKNGSSELKDKTEELCDDDIYCSICLDDECPNTNVILLCDSCNLAVHQECYGVPFVPEGQWLCSWCLHEKESCEEEGPVASKKPAVILEKGAASKKILGKSSDQSMAENDGACCLCPVRGGALKKTNDGRWAHVLCALWIPEVGFENIDYLEPITKLEEVPPARHKLSCSVCKKKDAGACIQCMKRNCYVAFHIMCAQKVGTYMKIEQGSGEQGDSPSNIKKSFYCDLHKPEGAKPFAPMYNDDDDAKSSDGEVEADAGQASDGESPQRRKGGKSRKKGGSRSRSRSTNKRGAEKKVKGKSSRSKSSKSLTSKSTSSTLRPSGSVPELPVIPLESLLNIESECFGTRSGTLIGPVYGYWLLKRKSRNNLPLLKAFYTTLMSNNITERLGGADDTKAALEGLKNAKRLRNEMEKVRLLLELVRKREKVKLLMIKSHEQEVLMKLHPWNSHLLKLLNTLQPLDKCGIFAQPVSLEQVPGYDKEIQRPMDFSTMRRKVLDFAYDDLEDFETDFNLMIDNCLKFNSKNTMYYKAAVKLRKQAAPIFKESHEKRLEMRFDPEAEEGPIDHDATEIIADARVEVIGDREIENPDAGESSKVESVIMAEEDGDSNDDSNVDDSILKQQERTVCYEMASEKSKDVKENDLKSCEIESDAMAVDEEQADKDDAATLPKQSEEETKIYDALEISNIESTKLYHHEEISECNITDLNVSQTYDNPEEDYGDDVIVETISINDEEVAGETKSSPPSEVVVKDRAGGGSGKEMVGQSRKTEEVCKKQDPLTTKLMRKQEILKFLASLTRLVQSSSEETIQKNISIDSISDGGLAMSISRESVEMMNDCSRPRSTRKTSSIYRSQTTIQDALEAAAASSLSSSKAKPKTPVRLKFDPPRSNSTPFSCVKMATLNGDDNSTHIRCKSGRRAATATEKALTSQFEGKVDGTPGSEASEKASSTEGPCMLPFVSEVVSATDGRRTSERTKTATHRYLIDDDNIMAALMSPSKNRKRKNSSQDGLVDEISKMKTEDEPPVLSRCPSPIEEKEEVAPVMSMDGSPSLDLLLNPTSNGIGSSGENVIVNKDVRKDPYGNDGNDDDDDYNDFEESSLALYHLNQMSGPSFKGPAATNNADDDDDDDENAICQDNDFEPAKKKMKMDAEAAPPHLIKSTASKKKTKSPYDRTTRPSAKSSGGTSSKRNNRSLAPRSKVGKEKSVFESTFPSSVTSPMPELEKNATKEQFNSSSSLDAMEMPRLDDDDGASRQNPSLSVSEVVSFSSNSEEDVLVAEECYADADDPAVASDNSPSSGSSRRESASGLFFGLFNTLGLSMSSKKRQKESSTGRADVKNLPENKRSKKDPACDLLDPPKPQRSPKKVDLNFSSAKLRKETSDKELTAANALLDFRRSLCQGEKKVNQFPVDSRKKNIFDEFNKLSAATTTTLSSAPSTPNGLKGDGRLTLESIVSKASLPPTSFLEGEGTPLERSEPSTSSSETSSESTKANGCTTEASQVEFFSKASRLHSGNPEVDSAYSTSSSSSSSSLTSPSPTEERCAEIA